MAGTLTFGGLVISGNDARICIDLVDGWRIPADIRAKNWIVPRLDGQIEGNRRKDTLTLPLAGKVQGFGSDADARRADFDDALSDLMAVMDPSLPSATLTLADGYLGVADSVAIECVVNNAAPGRMQSGQAFQLWTFELLALIPEWTLGS